MRGTKYLTFINVPFCVCGDDLLGMAQLSLLTARNHGYQRDDRITNRLIVMRQRVGIEVADGERRRSPSPQ